SGGTGPGTYTYIWSDGQATNPAIDLTGSSSMTATVTDENGCTATTSTVVVGNDVLDPSVAYAEPTVVSYGGSSGLTAFYHEDADYAWSTPNGPLTEFPSPMVTEIKETTNYIVIMSYGECADVRSVTVEVLNPQINNIPNAFSPNNDGINDTWIINNIEAYPENKLKIYNRWGQVVYKQVGYSPENAFNGKRLGQDLPEATYWYHFVLDQNIKESEKYTGTVIIIR
ncbi:MAG: gliding motility-associated C-terminal domain-containing protein, partial [Flavobacteriales bacterium]|nr:gliding motility-associated C-terminal domain-containing protein [Flavobacteriales bacterium]